MKTALIGVLLPAILFGGCASGLPGLRPLSYATPGEAIIHATSDKCPHEPGREEFGGLVAAALTGAASQLLKNFGAALSEGAKGGALPSSAASQNVQLDPGVTPKCLVVLRGSFQPVAGMAEVDLPTFLELPAAAADERRRVADLGLPPVFRVDHWIELRVDASANGKALTFAPVFVKVGRSIDGAVRGERDLSIALKFNRVGAEAVGSAVVVADRRIGLATTWQRSSAGRFRIEAPWFGTFHPAPSPAGSPPAPAAPTPTPAAVGGVAPPVRGPVGGGGEGAGGAVAGPPSQAPGSTRPTMESARAEAVPVTVTATVVETRPTNEGLAFVAAVFNGIQPRIEQAVRPLVDSDARETANAAAATTELVAQVEFATLEGAARSAVIGYCSLASTAADAAGRQDRLAKSTAARVAQLKANAAAIKAQVALPYPSLAEVSVGDPATVNTATCAG